MFNSDPPQGRQKAGSEDGESFGLGSGTEVYRTVRDVHGASPSRAQHLPTVKLLECFHEEWNQGCINPWRFHVLQLIPAGEEKLRQQGEAFQKCYLLFSKGDFPGRLLKFISKFS